MSNAERKKMTLLSNRTSNADINEFITLSEAAPKKIGGLTQHFMPRKSKEIQSNVFARTSMEIEQTLVEIKQHKSRLLSAAAVTMPRHPARRIIKGTVFKDC